MRKTSKNIIRLLGVSFFAKALTHILGGLIGICGMGKTDLLIFMGHVVESAGSVYSGILLQIVSCVIIVIIGTLLFQLTDHKTKLVPSIALCLYCFEAVLLAVSQIIAFALLNNSQIYAVTGDASLANGSNILLSSMDFTMNIANIPFGVGAILFFYLLLKNNAISKWISFAGLATAVLLLIGTIIQVYGIVVPFGIMVLYAAFEFIAGVYLFLNPQKSEV